MADAHPDDYLAFLRISDRHGVVHLARMNHAMGSVLCGYHFVHHSESPSLLVGPWQNWQGPVERVCPACRRVVSGGPVRPSPAGATRRGT